jgi:hypothetical protein
MSSSQRPARQRNLLDYHKLENVGREEALIRRATKPNSNTFDLDTNLNIDSNSNLNVDYNIDPALKTSYDPTANSAANLPIYPIYLEYDHLLANAYINSSASDTDDDSLDTKSNAQPPSSDINPSESVSQTKSEPSTDRSWVYPYFHCTVLDG